MTALDGMKSDGSSSRRGGAEPSDVFSVVMSEKTFDRLSEFIHNFCGIKMPPAKKTMLEGRLRKRLRALGMRSFEEYCKFALDGKGGQSEYIHMIDVVTTNKTDFFRESGHFDYLVEKVLPELLQSRGSGGGTRINVWSAGCSTGEEPYTLAMVLSEFSERISRIDFSILATDISTSVLEKARRGVYEHEKVEPVALNLRRKYLLRGKGEKNDFVRIRPELRECVTFRRLNLLEDDYPFSEPMHIIFCRNVMIYFDRSTQEKLVKKFCAHLAPGGYFFTGHSETLHGLDLPLASLAANVHRRL
jgi:chemotaxis protein methyltransferase CheR